MVKRDGVILEKNPSLRVREDWWVFEKIHHYGKRKTGVVSKESLWQGKDGGSFGLFFAKSCSSMSCYSMLQGSSRY